MISFIFLAVLFYLTFVVFLIFGFFHFLFFWQFYKKEKLKVGANRVSTDTIRVYGPWSLVLWWLGVYLPHVHESYREGERGFDFNTNRNKNKEKTGMQGEDDSCSD